MSSKISLLEDYDSPPNSSARIPLADSGDNYYINGNDIGSPFAYRITSGAITTLTLLARLQITFDDTTDREIASTDAPTRGGWELVISAIQAPAIEHKFVLPSGITFDGTNRACVLTSATDVLIARSVTATRYVIIYNNGCTFAAS